MRDSQIAEIMPLLHNVWVRQSHLNFGQLIAMLAKLVDKDPAGLDDDELLMAIQKFYESEIKVA